MHSITPFLGQTDITGVLTQVNTYVPTAVGIAVAILLFVLGRRVVRKLVS